MTNTPTAATAALTHADPFAGLTEVDAHRIGEAMTAAVTESTRTVYGHSWRRWERWCSGRGMTPLPAAPAAVCAYLTERAAEGASASGIDTACSAISYVHRSHGYDDPTLIEGLRQVRRTWRSRSTAPTPITIWTGPPRPGSSAKRCSTSSDARRRTTATPRRLGDDSERVRKMIRARVHRAILLIADHHPQLAEHLRDSIETGNWCTYRPAETLEWTVVT